MPDVFKVNGTTIVMADHWAGLDRCVPIVKGRHSRAASLADLGHLKAPNVGRTPRSLVGSTRHAQRRQRADADLHRRCGRLCRSIHVGRGLGSRVPRPRPEKQGRLHPKHRRGHPHGHVGFQPPERRPQLCRRPGGPHRGRRSSPKILTMAVNATGSERRRHRRLHRARSTGRASYAHRSATWPASP